MNRLHWFRLASCHSTTQTQPTYRCLSVWLLLLVSNGPFFSPQAAYTSKHKQNKSLHTPMTYSNRAGVRWMTFTVLLWQSGRENEEMWCMNMSKAFCECVGVRAFVSARAASVSTAVTDSSAGRMPPLRELPSVLWLSLVMRRERKNKLQAICKPIRRPAGPHEAIYTLLELQPGLALTAETALIPVPSCWVGSAVALVGFSSLCIHFCGIYPRLRGDLDRPKEKNKTSSVNVITSFLVKQHQAVLMHYIWLMFYWKLWQLFQQYKLSNWIQFKFVLLLICFSFLF